MKIKETKTRITEYPNLTENVTTMGKRATGWLVVDQIIKKNRMLSTNSFWEPKFVDKSKKMTINNTSKNG